MVLGNREAGKASHGPLIRFDHVSKRFGPLSVIDDLSLDIEAGDFISLLGPSGSGKTTLLMMLAGFQEPSQGSILLEGQSINRVPPHRREMGVVFQSYALFPHMTVAENVAFPLRMRKVKAPEIAERVQRALDMVRLGNLSDRPPTQLSGGQRQRVALARALVFAPRVVLMDEPLGALDKKLREQMQLEIRELHAALGLTTIFVTHDQSEALTISSRIAVFDAGKIVQVGKPRDIYDRPRTRFVAEFIGDTNLLNGLVVAGQADAVLVKLAGGATLTAQACEPLRVGEKVLIAVRPERLKLAHETPSEGIHLPVRILDSVYHGDSLTFRLDASGQTLDARVGREKANFNPGDDVSATFKAHDCWAVRE